MPYGIWTCADGRQVLFNRRYKPMQERTAEGVLSQADPNEWVEWKEQRRLFDAGASRKEREQRRCATLKEWENSSREKQVSARSAIRLVHGVHGAFFEP
jgi:hypothetical protein